MSPARLAAAMLTACFPCVAATAIAADPVRHVESGDIRGTDGAVATFLGIPYAAPPTGVRRWRPPAPAQSWKGVRDARTFGSDCIQTEQMRRNSRAPGTSEDCLFLNVWEPRHRKSAKLPVMLWVYGGSFLGGSGSNPTQDGTALSRQGAVVVSFNYRTGIFGFFSHPQLSRESGHGASGNYGIMDTLAALRWVRRNIAAFGGDPDRITVFGESSGASLLGMMLVSPLSKGLFRSAILESPGVLRPLSTLSDAEASGFALGTDLAALRGLSADELQEKAAASIPAVRAFNQPRIFGPTVDGWVLPTSDKEALERGTVVKVPLIIGGNAAEGRLFVSNWPIGTVSAYETFVATNFGSDAPEILREYPANSDKEVKPQLARLFADNQFNNGNKAFAARMSELGVPVWRYLFAARIGQDELPATHGDELPFVFGNLSPGASARDKGLSDLISAAWVRFAKSGDPNGGELVDWRRYDRTKVTIRFPSRDDTPVPPGDMQSGPTH